MGPFKIQFHHCGSVCVGDGWLTQPHLAPSDWTLGLVESAHLLQYKQSVCNRLNQPSPHALRRSAAWQRGILSMFINCSFNNKPDITWPPSNLCVRRSPEASPRLSVATIIYNDTLITVCDKEGPIRYRGGVVYIERLLTQRGCMQRGRFYTLGGWIRLFTVCVGGRGGSLKRGCLEWGRGSLKRGIV